MGNFNWPSITTSAGPVQYQLDGANTTVSQDTVTPSNSTPLPVLILNDNGTPADPATETTLAALNAKVTACNTGAVTISSALPAGNNNIGDVDVASLPVAFNAGAASATTQRVVIVTDQTAIPVSQSGTWNIGDITGTISLPTGAATEATLSSLNGKVTACNTGAVTISSALPAGTNNIGDVDVLTLPVSFNTGASDATTQRVVLASDSPSSVQPINTGSFSQITNLVNSAQTFTAPAGAIGFKIQAPSTNTENVSFSIGAVATITAGILMEPGRSEDFDTGSNISVIATSATNQTVNVLWKVRP